MSGSIGFLNERKYNYAEVQLVRQPAETSAKMKHVNDFLGSSVFVFPNLTGLQDEQEEKN